MIEKVKHYVASKKPKDAVVNRVFKASFWSLTGSITAKIIVLISTMIVARILTTDSYGQLGMIRTTILMFVTLASVGMGTTASKFIAQYRDTDKYKAIRVYLSSNVFAFFMASVTAIIIFLLANNIAEHSLNDINLSIDIKIASAMLFFSIINGAQQGSLQGFEDFKSIAKVNLITAMAEAIFVILGAYYYNLTGAVIGFSISFLITTYCNFIYIRRHTNLSIRKISESLKLLSYDDFKLIIKFSIPLAISSLIMIPATWIIKVYMIKVSGYTQMAFFDVADQWKNQVLYIPGILSGIILPILSNNSSSQDFWKVIKLNILSNATIAIVLSIIVIFIRNIILSGYGTEYVDNSKPFVILAITAIIITLSNITIPILVSRNCVYQGLAFNIILILLQISLSYYLLNKGMGATGLAYAMLISYTLTTGLQFLYIYRKKKYWDNLIEE